MYVSEICAEGIFVTFPWWLKNVKSRSKIALFSNERHFEIWFPKKRTITFFWSQLSKLHKKRPNFACGNYIFPKTRGNKNKPYRPIPHPLNHTSRQKTRKLCGKIKGNDSSYPLRGSNNHKLYDQDSLAWMSELHLVFYRLYIAPLWSRVYYTIWVHCICEREFGFDFSKFSDV